MAAVSHVRKRAQHLVRFMFCDPGDFAKMPQGSDYVLISTEI